MNSTGGEFTNTDSGDGIINFGYFSVGFDDSFGVPFTLLNNGGFDNYGTFDNNGNVIDSNSGQLGNVRVRCDASYNLIRYGTPVTPPYDSDPFASPFHIDGANHEISYEDCVIPDSDGDTVRDDADAFPDDGSESVDTDGDGYGDNNIDKFPLNKWVYADADGDCGDLSSVIQTETLGTGCGDSDSDPGFRYSDAFPLNPQETADSDGDCGVIETQTTTSGNGCGNNSDRFWLNPLEIIDTDGDCGNTETQTPTWGNGCADNSDAFPNDSDEISDQDYDGVGDNADTFPNDPDNSRKISVDNTNGWRLTTGLFMANLIRDPLPDGGSLTDGLVNFTLSGGSVGSTSEITFTYDAPIDPSLVWWKYGRTADNDTAHWYVFDGAIISGNTVTLRITDGGTGDDDLFANGSITDPGGLGMLPQANDDTTVTDTDTSGSGGGAMNLCFLFLLWSLRLLKLEGMRKKNYYIND